jgi:hypothetical protein
MTDFSKRIAFIILPLRDNQGRRTTEAHAALRDAVLGHFGGYTQTLVTGVWRNEDGVVFNDDSLKYEIAMDTGAGAGKKLVEIAAQACRDADQQCVVIQLASGVVHFITPRGDMT